MPELLTLRQIWIATPHGQAIKNPEYLKFCEILESLTATSLEDFACRIPELWDSRPEKAIKLVQDWANIKKKYNPNYLKEIKQKQFKKFLQE